MRNILPEGPELVIEFAGPIEAEKLMMERGVINPEKVVSQRFPLSQIHHAVETMAGREWSKVVINP